MSMFQPHPVMRIKLFTILLVVAVAVPILALADIGDYRAGSYEFHLYFDNDQLFADRDFQFKYDVSTQEYVEPALVTGFPYRGEIINFAGEAAANFKFDPRGGDSSFKTGKISVRAPYVPDGQRAVFYDPQGNPVLTIPVSESSYCNDDGICNADRGEDGRSCPRDCRTSTTMPVPPAASAPTSTGTGGSYALGLVFMLIGVALIGGLWWLFKKRDSGPTSMPPSSFGPTQDKLPTPPAPPSNTTPPSYPLRG